MSVEDFGALVAREQAELERQRQQAIDDTIERIAGAARDNAARLGAARREDTLRGEWNRDLWQIGRRVAHAADRQGVPQDAVLGRFPPRTIGWIIDLAQKEHVSMHQGYYGTEVSRSHYNLSALLLGPGGELIHAGRPLDHNSYGQWELVQKLRGVSSRRDGPVATILNWWDGLGTSTLEVQNLSEYQDARKKLARFVVEKHISL